jgi:hypothetical protein
MKIKELFEAITPEEKIRMIYSPGERWAMIIGGRILTGTKLITLGQSFNKLNLKNVKNPGPSPLLFHGSTAEFNKFNDRSWFSTEPLTAGFHAAFGTRGNPFVDLYMYVCAAKLGKIAVVTDITPGKESLIDIDRIYSKGYDSFVIKNVSDAGVGPNTDLYNIKDGSQVKILKRWLITDEVTDTEEEFDQILSGRTVKKPDVDQDLPFTVDDPGLTQFKHGQKISKDDYEIAKSYGLTVFQS